MALTPQEIQQISNSGGGQQLYDMVRSGQASEAEIRAALGDSNVDAFLARTQQQAPVAAMQGVNEGGGGLFNLSPPTNTYEPPATGNIAIPGNQGLQSGNIAIPASQGSQTPNTNYTPPGNVVGVPTNTGTPQGNVQPGSAPPSYTASQGTSTANTGMPVNTGTTTTPQTTPQTTGNAGGYLNTQVPGGTTTNNNYTQYPTTIPQSPNYVGAANQQADANLNAAKNTVALSNPNQNTTYGSQTYTIGPDGRPVQNQSLSADQQKRLDDLNSILPSVTQNIREQTAKPISSYDFQDVMNLDNITLPERQTQTGTAGQSAVAEALRAREAPRLERERSKAETDLLVRGFNPGTEGWNERMDDYNRSANDFNLGLTALSGQEQSRLFDLDTQNRNTRRSELESLFGAQMDKRASQVGEQVTARTLPIQEYAGLVQAMQPNLPQFNQYTGASVEPNPIFNATTQQGIFDLGRYGTSVQGELGSRGINTGSSDSDKQAAASLAAAAAMFFSDARLKHTIRKAGELLNGISLYTWKWTRKGEMLAGNQPEFGVLAQDIEKLIPSAISMKQGYYQVDYSKVLTWRTAQPAN